MLGGNNADFSVFFLLAVRKSIKMNAKLRIKMNVKLEKVIFGCRRACNQM